MYVKHYIIPCTASLVVAADHKYTLHLKRIAPHVQFNIKNNATQAGNWYCKQFFALAMKAKHAWGWEVLNWNDVLRVRGSNLS